jgi:hypothetical protein
MTEHVIIGMVEPDKAVAVCVHADECIDIGCKYIGHKVDKGYSAQVNAFSHFPAGQCGGRKTGMEFITVGIIPVLRLLPEGGPLPDIQFERPGPDAVIFMKVPGFLQFLQDKGIPRVRARDEFQDGPALVVEQVKVSGFTAQYLFI